jgi:hypothetical protein
VRLFVEASGIAQTIKKVTAKGGGVPILLRPRRTLGGWPAFETQFGMAFATMVQASGTGRGPADAPAASYHRSIFL